MKQPIWLMLGLTIMGFGQITGIQSSMAQDSGDPPNLSDTGGTIIDGQNNLGNNTGGDLTGDFDPNSERFGFSDLDGGFGISPEIINLIPSTGGTGSIRRGTTTEDGGSTALGDRNDITNTDDTTNTDENINTDDTSEITICSSDPCAPDDGVGKAITLNDLAKLIEEDLNNSFDDLVAAEKLEQELIERPRRVIKRNSSNSCNCTACVNPALEARREFEKKLQNSQEFVEQMQRFKPENSIW